MLLIKLEHLLTLRTLLELMLGLQQEISHLPFLLFLLVIINQALLIYLRQLFLLETLMSNNWIFKFVLNIIVW